jgi:hypothetical protein
MRTRQPVCFAVVPGEREPQARERSGSSTSQEGIRSPMVVLVDANAHARPREDALEEYLAATEEFLSQLDAGDALRHPVLQIRFGLLLLLAQAPLVLVPPG